MAEGDLRSGESAGDLGPEDARALLGAFVDAVGLEPGRALIEHMQADEFSHAELARRARRTHERRLREGRRGDGRGGRKRGRAVRARQPRGGGRPQALPSGDPGDPLRAGCRVPRQGEGEARAHRGPEAHRPRRRRDRRRPRCGSHDRADPRARRPRLRGRGGRHRRQRRSPPLGGRRGRDALLRRAGNRCPEPAGDGRGPGRGPLRRGAPDGARPGRRDGGADRPDHGPPGPGQLAHRAGRLRGRALLLARARAGDGHGPVPLLPAVWPRALAQPGQRRVAHPPRHRAWRDRPLGPRRRHLAVRPRSPRRRLLPGPDQGPVCGKADEGEGRRATGRLLHAGARGRSEAPPPARRRRARGGDPPRPPWQARHLPRLAGGR